MPLQEIDLFFDEVADFLEWLADAPVMRADIRRRATAILEVWRGRAAQKCEPDPEDLTNEQLADEMRKAANTLASAQFLAEQWIVREARDRIAPRKQRGDR